MRTSTLIAPLLAALLSACGAGSLCDRNSLCQNDPIATPGERETCRSTLNANMNSACYSEVVATLNCGSDNAICGSDGKTDSTLTSTKVTNNCTSQIANQLACCTKNPTATACTALGTVGGGTTNPCDARSPCANDPARTSSQIADCKAKIASAMGSACYSEALVASKCITEQAVCGSDGKTDGNATFSHCSSQISSFSTCCNSNSSSASCQ
jgi:hypothetical protein